VDDATPEQPRIPGVKYRKVTRHRTETTEIDGVPSTRQVPYGAWEPVPPRDWDELILRGVTGMTIAVTIIAVAATTASVGGLLHALVPAAVAYSMGVVFTCSWLACLGVEWLNRVDPERAKPARNAGWVALAISMGAVFAYGHTLHQEWAGGFGSCMDLLAKGLWALLLRHHAVPLDAGVAHWVTEQEQKLAGRELLSARLLRLNRGRAYRQAVGGREFQAADAILGRAEAARTLTPPDEPPPVVRITSEQAGAPVPPPSGQPAPAPAPAPAGSVPPVPPAVDEQPTAETTGPIPPVEITRPAMAEICRREIAANSNVTDAELVDAMKAAGHPDRPNLADTVRRTAQRVDPSRKAKAS
jgi:hypothetical protein